MQSYNIFPFFSNNLAFFCNFAAQKEFIMRKSIVIIALTALLAACQESLEEKAAREARVYTEKNCPAKLSETLRMDSLTFETATRTLHYYYTLTGTADVDSMQGQDNIRQALLNELKNTTSVKAYKDAGYTFDYIYYSEKNPGKKLFEANFTTKDYQKPSAD